MGISTGILGTIKEDKVLSFSMFVGNSARAGKL